MNGRTPRPTNSATLDKEKTDLLTGSKQTRQQRTNLLGNMTASTMKREIRRLAIDDASGGEAGIMRVQLFQSLGLGLPKPKNWTAKSIRYMLDNVTHTTYDNDQIKLKDDAVALLRDALAKKPTEPPPDPNNRYRRSA